MASIGSMIHNNINNDYMLEEMACHHRNEQIQWLKQLGQDFKL